MTLLLVVLSLIAPARFAATHPRHTVAFYIETYGELLPRDDPAVAKAHQVFARVRAVADKSIKRLPRLVVINGRNDPWAIALPDGHVVLSRRAVDSCSQLASLMESCLAFVIGHELAHLSNDDFLHKEVHGFLTTSGMSGQVKRLRRELQRSETRELAADDKGYVYAAMAGYPVDELLQDRALDKGDFFHFWMQQSSAQLAAPASNSDARTAVLRKRLREIQDKFVYFEFGVRLSHFDYCDDAQYFFREFQQTFPGREVLNNLGFCYLQMARQAMTPERAYFYWMPLLLDGTTRAGVLVSRGGEAIGSLKQAVDDRAKDLLQQAVEHLSYAAKADPDYVPARVNLAVAYLYLGRPHQARATLQEARRLAPNDPDLLGLDAIITFEQSEPDIDLWTPAVSKLRQLVDRPGVPSAVLFNLGRLMQVRGQSAAAKKYWHRLVRQPGGLPWSIRDIVCDAANRTSNRQCQRRPAATAHPTPWRWPMPAEGLQPFEASRLNGRPQEWNKDAFDWMKADLHGHIYQHGQTGAALLELDDFVQMQVLKGERLADADDIQRYCAAPLRERDLPNGRLWSCNDWAALARGDQVKELWWVAR